MTTHTTFYLREDGEDEVEIEVEFTLTGGHGGSAPTLTDPGDPPEPPEMEIGTCRIIGTGAQVELTDEEAQAVYDDVFDRLGDFEDDAGYEDF